MRQVPYVDLSQQFAQERERIMPVLEDVLRRGQWVSHQEAKRFEEAVAGYCGTEHVVAVGSGTDALILALRALGIGAGHEVITVPNSFISTAAAIVNVGARPVFVDVCEDQNLDPTQLKDAITERTRAIIPVHLTGRMADMPAIMELARRHDLKVIEDAAQAFGSRLHGHFAGTLGHAGCFSAHPLKNLNAMGDAGFVLTRDAKTAARIRRLRDNGLVDRDHAAEWGLVSRLDSVQAAVLLCHLESLDLVLQRRRANARRYQALLADVEVSYPPMREHAFDTYHTFVIQSGSRDRLKQHLHAHGVGSAVHYPLPLHLQPAAAPLGYKAGDFPVAERQAGRILSLPVHQFLSEDDLVHVASCIGEFLA